MGIRLATPNDAMGISRLLTQLGYSGTEAFIGKYLHIMLSDPREVLLVWADDTTILGFLSLDFSIYPSLGGPVATIKAFAVDENARSLGIGGRMEAEVTRQARVRGCSRIVVHCAEHRARAHEFYLRQGYEEDPKYLVKKF
jgi:GNAT superfamily N-acetyltransferase